jgi:protein-S-isoprenylcysteine O-methyltransferase Ste14
MYGRTWFVVGFLALAFAERVAQSCQSHATERGELKMVWSLYAMYGTYTLIVTGAGVESLSLRSGLSIGWSVLGVVLYLMSVVLRRISIRTLGKFWSLQVEIRREHRLIREGPYRYVRHPIYSAIVLEVLSIPLTVNAWLTLLFAVVTHVPLVLLRMRLEEKALAEKLGDEYRRYQQEVGALLPKASTFRLRSGAVS